MKNRFCDVRSNVSFCLSCKTKIGRPTLCAQNVFIIWTLVPSKTSINFGRDNVIDVKSITEIRIIFTFLSVKCPNRSN